MPAECPAAGWPHTLQSVLTHILLPTRAVFAGPEFIHRQVLRVDELYQSTLPPRLMRRKLYKNSTAGAGVASQKAADSLLYRGFVGCFLWLGTAVTSYRRMRFNEFILVVELRQIRIGKVLANTVGSDQTRPSTMAKIRCPATIMHARRRLRWYEFAIRLR
mgnify:CR=1 FL=1